MRGLMRNRLSYLVSIATRTLQNSERRESMQKFALLVATAGCTCQMALGIIWRHDVGPGPYEILAQSPQFSPVVRVNWMSGTIIGNGWWVLTAAHGLPFNPNAQVGVWLGDPSHPPSHYSTAIYFHPNWNPNSPNYNFDIALIRLNQQITSVTPAQIYRGRNESGQIGYWVGYGIGGDGVTGYDGHGYPFPQPKRAMKNRIANVSDYWIQTMFDPPESPSVLDLEGTGSPGDSGGPAFIQENGVWYLAGIISLGGGWGRYNSWMSSVRVSTHADWIDSTMRMPEPSSVLGVVVGCTMLLAVRRRWQARFNKS